MRLRRIRCELEHHRSTEQALKFSLPERALLLLTLFTVAVVLDAICGDRRRETLILPILFGHLQKCANTGFVCVLEALRPEHLGMIQFSQLPHRQLPLPAFVFPTRRQLLHELEELVDVGLLEVINRLITYDFEQHCQHRLELFVHLRLLALLVGGQKPIYHQPECGHCNRISASWLRFTVMLRGEYVFRFRTCMSSFKSRLDGRVDSLLLMGFALSLDFLGEAKIIEINLKDVTVLVTVTIAFGHSPQLRK